MQRFIISAIGILCVILGFNALVSAQTGTDIPTALTQQETAAPTQAPAAPESEAPTQKPEAPAVEVNTDNEERIALLAEVPAPSAARIPSYDRKAHFTPNGKGDSWADVDGNSCDTRNDILARDLTDVTKKDHCVVLTGVLADPYTGENIEFVRDIYQDGKKVGGNSMTVQIDHIIPLSLAWNTGASSWTQDERVAFANDPENLLASDGPSNSSKGAKGPSQWMPSDAGNGGYDCTYAQTFTDLLIKYDLAASPADTAALVSALETCDAA